MSLLSWLGPASLGLVVGMWAGLDYAAARAAAYSEWGRSRDEKAESVSASVSVMCILRGALWYQP